MLQGSFLYEEDMPVLNWEITNERQRILSYNCKKATVSFRGRDYVAWFTSDIPISNGPWKFGGLPGLILKLYDTNENFIFECDGIEQLKNKELIKFFQVKYKRLKRENLNKLYQQFHNNFKGYMNALGIDVDFGTSKSAFKLPYNPIELE
jgi:GLPGLI family protein